MVEQLDMFAASVCEEEKTPKKKDSGLTPRQWALYRLIKLNSLIHCRKTTQREIYEELKEYGYAWNDDPKIHDHCSAIWKDVKDNNESYEHDKIIICKNFEYWIGNEKETKKYLDKLWKDLCPRLVRYWNYKSKLARNGQGQLFSTKLNPIDESSKAREFIESYGEERISED